MGTRIPYSARIGQRFGRLKILRIHSEYSGTCSFVCICDCGEKTIVQYTHILQGKTKSCGCLVREVTVRRNAVHGLYGTAAYRSWQAMLQRCCNPRHHAWANYGGRGIAVCDRWRNSFANFFGDMGPRPAGKSIDRYPNNDGNYEPGNCRWATRSEQALNRRRLKLKAA